MMETSPAKSTAAASLPLANVTKRRVSRSLHLISSTIESAGRDLDPRLIHEFAINLRSLISKRGGTLTLRDDQIECLEKILERVTSGKCTGFFDLFPRWGKSVLITVVASAWPGRSIVISEFRTLLSDLRKKLSVHAPHKTLGKLGAATNPDIALMSAHGFARASMRRSEQLSNFTLTLWDENHLSLTQRRIAALDKIRSNGISFGLTGSDHFNDSKNCRLVWGDCIKEVTLNQGFRNGALRLPVPVFVQTKSDISEIPFRRGELERTALERHVLQQPERLRQIIDIIQKHPHGGVLIYVAGVTHGEAVRDLLVKLGYSAECLFGKYKSKNENTITRFRAGELRILIGRKLLGLGLDLPEANILIKTVPIFSQNVAEQLFPRIMTLDPNNPTKTPYVYEFLYQHPRGHGVLYPSIVDGEILVKTGYNSPGRTSSKQPREDEVSVDSAKPAPNPYITAIDQILDLTRSNQVLFTQAVKLPENWTTWVKAERLLGIPRKKCQELARNLCERDPTGKSVEKFLHPLGAHPKIINELIAALEDGRLKPGWKFLNQLLRELNPGEQRSAHEYIVQLARNYVPGEIQLAISNGNAQLACSPSLIDWVKTYVEDYTGKKLARLMNAEKEYPATVRALTNIVRTESENNLLSREGSGFERLTWALKAEFPYHELFQRISGNAANWQTLKTTPLHLEKLKEQVGETDEIIAEQVRTKALTIDQFGFEGQNLLLHERIDVVFPSLFKPIPSSKAERFAKLAKMQIPAHELSHSSSRLYLHSSDELVYQVLGIKPPHISRDTPCSDTVGSNTLRSDTAQVLQLNPHDTNAYLLAGALEALKLLPVSYIIARHGDSRDPSRFTLLASAEATQTAQQKLREMFGSEVADIQFESYARQIGLADPRLLAHLVEVSNPKKFRDLCVSSNVPKVLLAAVIASRGKVQIEITTDNTICIRNEQLEIACPDLYTEKINDGKFTQNYSDFPTAIDLSKSLESLVTTIRLNIISRVMLRRYPEYANAIINFSEGSYYYPKYWQVAAADSVVKMVAEGQLAVQDLPKIIAKLVSIFKLRHPYTLSTDILLGIASTEAHRVSESPPVAEQVIRQMTPRNDTLLAAVILLERGETISDSEREQRWIEVPLLPTPLELVGRYIKAGWLQAGDLMCCYSTLYTRKNLTINALPVNERYNDDSVFFYSREMAKRELQKFEANINIAYHPAGEIFVGGLRYVSPGYVQQQILREWYPEVQLPPTSQTGWSLFQLDKWSNFILGTGQNLTRATGMRAEEILKNVVKAYRLRNLHSTLPPTECAFATRPLLGDHFGEVVLTLKDHATTTKRTNLRRLDTALRSLSKLMASDLVEIVKENFPPQYSEEEIISYLSRVGLLAVAIHGTPVTLSISIDDSAMLNIKNGKTLITRIPQSAYLNPFHFPFPSQELIILLSRN